MIRRLRLLLIDRIKSLCNSGSTINLKRNSRFLRARWTPFLLSPVRFLAKEQCFVPRQCLRKAILASPVELLDVLHLQ